MSIQAPLPKQQEKQQLASIQKLRVKYKYHVAQCLPYQMQAQFQGLPGPLLPSRTRLFQVIPWAPFWRAAFICTASGLLTCDRQAGKGSCYFLTRHGFDSCHGKLKPFSLSSLFHPISAATGFLARTEVLWTAVLLWDASFHEAPSALRTKRGLYRAWPL